MFGNSLKFVKFVKFKNKLQIKIPNKSFDMFQKTAMLDFQNNGFLYSKCKKHFRKKSLKNPKFCEIQKKYNMLKDCMLNMQMQH